MTTDTSAAAYPHPAWVDAAPFRAYALHLVDATGIPWRVLAHLAAIPSPALHTLLFGRHNARRPHLYGEFAHALMGLDASTILAQRLRYVSARNATWIVQQLCARGETLSTIAVLCQVEEYQIAALAQSPHYVNALLDAYLAALAEVRRLPELGDRQLARAIVKIAA